MEVKVKTKYEVHIYIMWALSYMHDYLLNPYSFWWGVGYRLNGGQSQNKIGGADIHHVGTRHDSLKLTGNQPCVTVVRKPFN